MIAIRYLPVLGAWIQEHDEGGTKDNLLRLPGRPGVKQLALILSYAEGVTIPVVLAGVVGILSSGSVRDRRSRAARRPAYVPGRALVLLSFRTPVSIDLSPADRARVLDRCRGVPGSPCGAADWGCGRAGCSRRGHDFIILAGLPTLLSQYRDARRRDFAEPPPISPAGFDPGDGDVLGSSQRAGALSARPD